MLIIYAFLRRSATDKAADIGIKLWLDVICGTLTAITVSRFDIHLLLTFADNCFTSMLPIRIVASRLLSYELLYEIIPFGVNLTRVKLTLFHLDYYTSYLERNSLSLSFAVKKRVQRQNSAVWIFDERVTVIVKLYGFHIYLHICLIAWSWI